MNYSNLPSLKYNSKTTKVVYIWTKALLIINNLGLQEDNSINKFINKKI